MSQIISEFARTERRTDHNGSFSTSNTSHGRIANTNEDTLSSFRVVYLDMKSMMMAPFNRIKEVLDLEVFESNIMYCLIKTRPQLRIKTILTLVFTVPASSGLALHEICCFHRHSST